jgi:bifunctional DNase/RNase
MAFGVFLSLSGASKPRLLQLPWKKCNRAGPLTHDLMKNFMTGFSIDLHEIIICDLQEGIFYSKLVCSTEKDTLEIDSRTSDALALAVRFGCPIYTYENILDSAGILMEETTGKKKKSKEQKEVPVEETGGSNEDLKTMSLEDLNTLLNEVLESEDYIRAIAIRDEINNRKKK